MHDHEQLAESSPRAPGATTSSTSSTTPGASALRGELRGATFAEGEGRLAPVQRKEDGGSIAAPPGATTAPAPTRATPRAVQREDGADAAGAEAAGPTSEGAAPASVAASEGADDAAATMRNIVPTVHLVFEQLAHALAYEDSLSEVMKKDLHAWGYQTTRRQLSGRNGLQFSCYLPDPARAKEDYVMKLHGGKVRPVMAFRGTEGEGDLESDLGEGGVGRSQWLTNEALIRDQLMNLGGFGKVVVTGHSLGGALAQLTAAIYPGHVGEVVTFQSPGIPATLVADLKRHNDEAKPKDQVPSTHYQVEDDIIDEIGAAHTPGIVVSADVEEDGAIDAHTTTIGRSLPAADGGDPIKGDPALGGAGRVGLGELDDPDIDGAAGRDRLDSVEVMSTDEHQATRRSKGLEDLRRTSLNIEGRQEAEADATAEARKRALSGERWKTIIAPIENLEIRDIDPNELREVKRALTDNVQTTFRELWLAEQAIAGRLAAGPEGMLAAVAKAYHDQRGRPLTGEEEARVDRYLRRYAGGRYTSRKPATEAPEARPTEDPKAEDAPLMNHGQGVTL